MIRMRNHVLGWSLAAACTSGILATAACGSSSSSSPSPNAAATITIANNAVSPKNVVVPRGSQVLFVNNDTRSHDIASDPHPEHTDCPEINQSGFLSPGQSRETGNLVVVRTCGFHDHDNPSQSSLTGQIVIR